MLGTPIAGRRPELYGTPTVVYWSSERRLERPLLDDGAKEDVGELQWSFEHELVSGIEAVQPTSVGLRLLGDRAERRP